jgi:cytochrome b6-f complex iron-sulfur subunit
MDRDKVDIERRKFFSFLGWGSITGFITLSLLGLLRFVFPGVLYEPPARFKVGRPDDYPEDSVTFFKERKIFIMRDKEGILATSAICTHLGCIVRWMPIKNEFDCHCHGSKFDINGTNISGPAPRPLDHFYVKLDRLNRLIVDTKEKVDKNYRLKV